MDKRLKIVIASLIASVFPFVFYVASSSPPNVPKSKSVKVNYTAMTPKKSIESCVEIPFRTEIMKVNIISSKPDKSPRGIPRQIYHVAVLAKHNGDTFYGHQILVEMNNQCLVPFSGLGQDAPPISWSFSDTEAQRYALEWHTWRLENIPNERERVQNFLDSDSPKMPQEDYVAYSKLGYKMPSRWIKLD